MWARPEATLTTRPRDCAQRRQRGGGHAPRADRLTSSTASASSSGASAGALRRAEAGVVDQHVEPAEALDRRGHRARRPTPGRARRTRCRRRAGRARRPCAPLRAQLGDGRRVPIPPAAPVMSTRVMRRTYSVAGRSCAVAAPEAPRPVGPQRRVAALRVQVPARAAGVPHRALHAPLDLGVVARLRPRARTSTRRRRARASSRSASIT